MSMTNRESLAEHNAKSLQMLIFGSAHRIFYILIVYLVFFSFKKIIIVIIIIIPFLCLCTLSMPCAFGGQKRGVESLELKLQMVVSHRLGTGT